MNEQSPYQALIDRIWDNVAQQMELISHIETLQPQIKKEFINTHHKLIKMIETHITAFQNDLNERLDSYLDLDLQEDIASCYRKIKMPAYTIATQQQELANLLTRYYSKTLPEAPAEYIHKRVERITIREISNSGEASFTDIEGVLKDNGPLEAAKLAVKKISDTSLGKLAELRREAKMRRGYETVLAAEFENTLTKEEMLKILHLFYNTKKDTRDFFFKNFGAICKLHSNLKYDTQTPTEETVKKFLHALNH